uniref:Metalloendopeptidase n=1 Tax=Strongyloides papillosus TaxID=174720 RepID=A0A0N5C7F3_STREA
MFLIYINLIFILIHTLILNKNGIEGYYEYESGITTTINRKEFKWSSTFRYFIDRSLDTDKIRKAVKLIEKMTCLNFYEEMWFVYGNRGFNYMKDYSRCSFKYNEWNQKKYYENTIYLSPFCQHKIGSIQQLTLKMLGIYDVHNRPDRNKYIKINFSNIEEKYRKYFTKVNSSEPLFNTTFDFGSALHYKVDIYSNSRIPIVISKKKYYSNMLGQQRLLSFNDYKLLNGYYCYENCKGINNFCLNGGYLDSRSCMRCICPENFHGTSCEKVKHLHEDNCGNTYLSASESSKELIIHKDKTCNYYIKSKINSKIEITIVELNLVESKPCHYEMGLQIKYLKDKGNTGLCLCDKYSNITLLSEDNTVFIQYNGWTFHDKAVIRYREV